jgi:hypothetical protein
MNQALPMRIDFIGRIKNTKLAPAHYLQPLFEAITNSFDAIEDKDNFDHGLVRVTLHRRKQMEIDTGDFSKEPITAFEIEDNGIGFNDKNYESFFTADSTLKADRGGKGVGRFIWLKAFKNIHIESVFEEKGEKWRRTFDFLRTSDGIENHVKQPVNSETLLVTSVFLDNFEERYQEKCPIDASIIARRIIEHFFRYFIFKNVPNIELIDLASSKKYKLNVIFSEDFEPSLETKNFEIGSETFNIHDVLIRKPQDRQHQAHFCANRRVVETENLAGKIPHLDRALRNESGDTIFYSAYVTSYFLDERVDNERTGFNIIRKPSSLEVTWEDIVDNVIEKSKEFLQPFTSQASEETLERVKRYVEKEEPKYRYLLSTHRDAVQEISPTISDAKLEMELYKIHFQAKTQLKQEISEHLAQEEGEITDWELHQEKFRNIFQRLNEVTKSELAEYVVNRKSVLSFLEKISGKDEKDKYAKEEAIHEIIFPLRKTSNDIELKDHNLWIIDERLVYHQYLASDLPFKWQVDSPIKVESDARPDIIIFNKALALTEGDYPFNSIVIIEFKRPERNKYGDDKNPINQVYNYIRLIKEGKAKDENNKTIEVSPSIPFYCYVIATLTTELKKEADNYSYTPTPDGLGYFGYNSKYNAYIEIISYRKLIADAKRRNKAFFDKLCL